MIPPAPLVVLELTDPSAIGLRSAARIGARGATWVWRFSSAPSVSPGKTRSGRQSILPSLTGIPISPETVPKAVVCTSTGSAMTSSPSWSSGPRASPGSTPWTVAVWAASS